MGPEEGKGRSSVIQARTVLPPGFGSGGREVGLAGSHRTCQPRRMRVVRIIPDLSVDSIAAADEFYGGFLGLERQEMGLDWVTRYLAPSGASLQLLTHDASAVDVPVISIAVDDVDEAHEEALRRGYDIVHPLTTEPWGVRRFFVRTPDGQVLNIVRHRK